MAPKKKQKNISPKKICVGTCSKELAIGNFYVTNSKMFPDGRLNICKKCLLDMVDENDIVSVKDMLRSIDKPFLDFLWNDSESFGVYMRVVNSLPQYKSLTWADSDKQFNKTQSINESQKNINKKKVKEEIFEITDELMEKWGFGYSPDEYKFFEKKYAQLKNNYQEKTAMHREALLTYIRYRVKEELSTARGEVKDAKEWGQLAAKAAQDAKINPSQMSKSDLSDGLDTFGQLVRTVEQAVDIIPILPQFKQRPQDSVDFTIWCYVNYIRDLKGLPLCEYDEIYEFYEERKKEYEARFNKEQDEEMDDV